jgi:hypothetical protein
MVRPLVGKTSDAEELPGQDRPYYPILTTTTGSFSKRELSSGSDERAARKKDWIRDHSLFGANDSSGWNGTGISPVGCRAKQARSRFLTI